MEQVLIQLVIPLIGAFIIGLIVGYMFFKTGRSQRASANTSDVESLRQELLNKSNEADGFKARAAEFRALLSKRDAMVAERDNYLAELEGRLRATEAEVVSLRMSGTPAGRGGAGRRSFVEDDYDLDDDSPFVEEVPTGQIEVIDLRPGIEDYAADDIVDDIEVPVLARTGHSGVAHEVVGRSTSDLADDGTAGILDSVSRHAAPPMPRRSTAPTLGPPRTAAAPAAALDESDPADITQERSVRRAPRGPVHSPVSPAVDTPDLKSSEKPRWVLRNDEYAMKFFSSGPVEMTRNGNLKIGRITVQRKGGDGTRYVSIGGLRAPGLHLVAVPRPSALDRLHHQQGRDLRPRPDRPLRHRRRLVRRRPQAR